MQVKKSSIIASWIAGTAVRHATMRPVDLPRAVAEVREIDGVNPAILAEVAGLYLGSIEGKPTSSWFNPLVAQICFDAGADLSLVPAAILQSRNRSKVVWPGISLPDESVLRGAGPPSSGP